MLFRPSLPWGFAGSGSVLGVTVATGEQEQEQEKQQQQNRGFEVTWEFLGYNFDFWRRSLPQE